MCIWKLLDRFSVFCFYCSLGLDPFSRLTFWLPHKACKMLVPRPGIQPLALHWKPRVLTTGQPGKSCLLCSFVWVVFCHHCPAPLRAKGPPPGPLPGECGQQSRPLFALQLCPQAGGLPFPLNFWLYYTTSPKTKNKIYSFFICNL